MSVNLENVRSTTPPWVEHAVSIVKYGLVKFVNSINICIKSGKAYYFRANFDSNVVGITERNTNI